MTTATQTILFTDLAGYTESVAGADREGLHRILRQHEKRVRPIVEQYGGRVVKNIGDSFLCLFPAATDSLRAALDIQHLDHGREALKLRLAVNTGDVEIIDGDAFGDAVNLAARILAKTPAGEIWFSHATRCCMNASEIPWEPVGTYRLKGVPGEQPCYRVVPEDRVWVPDRVARAARHRRLVRITPDHPANQLPPDPVVLFQGFQPGSTKLAAAVDALPTLSPDAIYLAAYCIASSERQAWLDAGHGLVIGTPQALAFELDEHSHGAVLTGGDKADAHATLFFGAVDVVDLEAVIGGLALPAAPIADVVAAYHYDLKPDGAWATSADVSLMRIFVDEKGVGLEARCAEIALSGSLLEQGQTARLEKRVVINTPVGGFEFLPLKEEYAGVLLRDTDHKLGVKRGQTVEMGRKPAAPGLVFPTRGGQGNIRWCSGARARQAREQSFSLDRGLVGRRQYAVQVEGGTLTLEPLHKECATYVLRDGRLVRVLERVPVRFGDHVVAGTTVVALRKP
ncbi:MAG: hypothetical protein Kow006_33230 [Gammaproteobacteria bacterium]